VSFQLIGRLSTSGKTEMSLMSLTCSFHVTASLRALCMQGWKSYCRVARLEAHTSKLETETHMSCKCHGVGNCYPFSLHVREAYTAAYARR
jgi:hypothetical protein